MKELYKSYIEKFEKAKLISDKYELTDISEKIKNYTSEIPGFMVTVPLVGGFSTGKSSLLNYLFGRDILSTNITPETSVPAEIISGSNTVEYISENDSTTGTVEEYINKTVYTDKTKLVKISLENAFLSEIPGVRIVDMPGFDSGYERHNRAIDDYLPNSLAYIITVSADEGTVRESVINFLNELKLNDMPVYIVITKSDKVMPEELDNIKSHIRSVVNSSLGLNDPKIIVTSAEDEEGAEELKDVFRELQEKSDAIFTNKYSNVLRGILIDIRNYLIVSLKRYGNSSEQLAADKEKLEDSIKALKDEYVKEKERFAEQLDKCVESIKNKVRAELSNCSSTLENLIIQGNDISEKINFIVRNAITSEVNRQLDPKIKKYISNINDMINSNMLMLDQSGDIISPEVTAENIEIKNSLLEFVSNTSEYFCAALGSLLGPIGFLVGAAVGIVLSIFIKKGMLKKEERQRREAAREAAEKVINDVSENAGVKIEAFVYELRDKVNSEIEKNIDEQIERQKKTFTDAEQKLLLNEEERQKKYDELMSDKTTADDMIKTEKKG